MELLDLPNEILQKIVSYLPAKSLTRLGETCKFMNSLSNVDLLWLSFCKREYNVGQKSGWSLSYKSIYIHVLRPLPILGLKRVAITPGGGVVHTTWDQGEMRVNCLIPGDKCEDPLLSKPLFFIQWSDEKNALEANCVLGGRDTPNPAHIAQMGPHTVIQCKSLKCYESHDNQTTFFGRSFPGFPNGFIDYPNAFKGFNFNKGFSCPLLPLRSNPDVPCPVTPGIYKGNYGPHGVEILQASMSEEVPSFFECLKLTGDPNVPAGNVSIRVDLATPILLTAAQQESVEDLLELDSSRPQEAYEELRHSNDGNPDLRQPFQVPSSCRDRSQNIPKTCLARYTGVGRVAFHFFSSPSYSKLHFVKFDDDTFGVLWLELLCFSIFHRERQNFSTSEQC